MDKSYPAVKIEPTPYLPRIQQNCPPGCPITEETPVRSFDPRCMCGKPLWMVIPPGQHVHPCPVHPDYAVMGPPIMFCRSTPE